MNDVAGAEALFGLLVGLGVALLLLTVAHADALWWPMQEMFERFLISVQRATGGMDARRRVGSVFLVAVVTVTGTWLLYGPGAAMTVLLAGSLIGLGIGVVLRWLVGR